MTRLSESTVKAISRAATRKMALVVNFILL